MFATGLVPEGWGTSGTGLGMRSQWVGGQQWLPESVPRQARPGKEPGQADLAASPLRDKCRAMMKMTI